jgi:N-acylneuraminate cytidylyltransferase
LDAPRSVAIIPARANSKRIPGKNVKLFCGEPMIAYPIRAAKAAGVFERIVVSTDDEQIADIAKAFGAEVPFMRPAELADDFTGSNAVVLHALKELSEHGAHFDLVCCIYATAAFVQASSLSEGHRILLAGDATSAFSVGAYPHPVQRALRVDEAGHLAWMHSEFRETRSQDLPPSFFDAGQFYWATVESFVETGSFLTETTWPIDLPRWLTQDIDTSADWEYAEILYEVLAKRGKLDEVDPSALGSQT